MAQKTHDCAGDNNVAILSRDDYFKPNHNIGVTFIQCIVCYIPTLAHPNSFPMLLWKIAFGRIACKMVVIEEYGMRDFICVVNLLFLCLACCCNVMIEMYMSRS